VKLSVLKFDFLAEVIISMHSCLASKCLD